MQIDNFDALKTWLNSSLEPIFEGDLSKLAIYIIALLKKDKTEQELRKTVNDSLEVFLANETSKFVNSLFEAILNKSYLTAVTSTKSTTSTTSTVASVNETEAPVNDNKSSSIQRNQATTSRKSSSAASSNRRESIKKSSTTVSHSRRSHRDRHRNGRSFSQSESSSESSDAKSRSRSRSKSIDRDDEEEEEEEEEDESSKLIGTTSHDDDGWRRGRRRRNSRDSNSHQQYNHNNNQSSNSSGNGAGIMGAAPNNNNSRKYNNNQFNHENTNQPSTIQPIYNVHQQMDPQAVFYQQQQQQRNALNLRQGNRPRSLVSIVTHEEANADEAAAKPKYIKNGKGMKRSYTHDNQPIMENKPLLQTPQQQFYSNLPMNLPQISHQQHYIPHNIPPPHQHQQQQSTHMNIPHSTMMMKQQQQPSSSSNENTLIIRKIPKDLNNEEKMLEHFQQFGKIINIQINYNNFNDAALVQFSTHQEAFAAYKNPQPVFNNRFIRLFWLNQQQQQQQKWIPQQQQQQKLTVGYTTTTTTTSDEPVSKKHVKERLDFSNNINQPQLQQLPPKTTFNLQQQQYNEQYNKENKLIKESPKVTTLPVEEGAIPPVAATTTTSIAPPSSTKLVNVVTAESPKPATKTQQQIEERKAMILKLNEKTQKLIEEQIKQQKVLLQKIEQAKTTEEKNTILTMIKKISELIEQEKASIVKQSSEFLANTTTGSVNDGRKRKLVNVPQPMKLIKLPAKPISNKLVNYHHHQTDASSVGGGSSNTPSFLLSTPTSPSITTTKTYTNYRQSYATASVDHRPKELLITGGGGVGVENIIENEEERNLLIKYFKTFSMIETVKYLSDNKELFIEFQTRKDAEIAFSKGSVYKNKILNIKWHKSENIKKVVEEQQEIPTEQEPAVEKPIIEDEKLISSTSLNETESDIDKLFEAPEEELEDENEEDEEESRPWRS